jgi:hypothetical protein
MPLQRHALLKRRSISTRDAAKVVTVKVLVFRGAAKVSIIGTSKEAVSE